MDQENEQIYRLIRLSSDVMTMSRNILVVNLRFMDQAINQLSLVPNIVGTLCVDGQTIEYNPIEVLQLYKEENTRPTRAYLHMILHCVFQHFYVDSIIQQRYWNIACDMAVENAICGMELDCIYTEKQQLQVEKIDLYKDKVKYITAELLYRYFLDSDISDDEISDLEQLFAVDNHYIWYESGNGTSNQENESEKRSKKDSNSNNDGGGDSKEREQSTEEQTSENTNDNQRNNEPTESQNNNTDHVDKQGNNEEEKSNNQENGEEGQSDNDQLDGQSENQGNNGVEKDSSQGNGEEGQSDDDQLDGQSENQGNNGVEKDSSQGDGEDDYSDTDSNSQTENNQDSESPNEGKESSAGVGDSRLQDLLDDWQEIAQKMQVDLETFGKQRGDVAGSLVQNLKAVNREKYDYESFLRKFAVLGEVMQTNDDEFDYIFYTYGLKLYERMPLIEPLEYKEVKRIKEFAIAIDTSGSTLGELVQRFIEKTYNILKSEDTFFTKINLHIIQCDAKIQEHIKIESQEDFDKYLRSMVIKGGGGTDFRPVFQMMDELIERREFINLKGLIYFTDGDGVFPQKKPDYKVACVFLDDGFEIPEVPSWVIKLILQNDDV